MHRLQVLEIPANVSSLNSGDSFVLEVPAAGKLFVWHGTSANWREKTRAVDVANSMRASGQPGSSLKVRDKRCAWLCLLQHV